jgi:cytochrome o ubiquinol oxidase subunit 3
MSATTLTSTGAAPVFYDSGDHHPQQGTLLGFWLYLMSDCLIFAVLFAVYAVLGRSYAAGPSGADLFDLPVVAANTALLLFSSITYGFAMIAMQHGKKNAVLAWLAITGLFGLGFLTLEITEFAHLIHEGAGPQRSAFRHARPARDLRHHLARDADGAGEQARPHRREQAPAHVPVDVLALS